MNAGWAHGPTAVRTPTPLVLTGGTHVDLVTQGFDDSPTQSAEPPPADARIRQVTTPAPAVDWRSVLADDPAGLPEHTPEWVAAICASGRWSDASRLYQTEDGRRFVLPLVRRRGPAGIGGSALSYPSAWGIGGVTGVGLDAAVLRGIFADLRGIGYQRIGIRPNPLQAGLWTEAADPGVIRVPRRAHVLDLSGGIEAVQRRMRSATRGYIRKAVRVGVHVELDRSGRLLPAYDELYLKSIERWAARQHEPVALARWRGRRRDPATKLATMARQLGDRFVTALAYVEGRPAFGAIMLLGPTAHVTRSAMDIELVGTTKAGALVHQRLLELACAYGCRHYHLGESGDSRSLAQFKESFGAVAYDYAEYRFERLPYTRLDRVVRTTVKKVLRFRDT